MKNYRAYKFRIYPNKKQQEFLDKTFGCCRFLWNKMLYERNAVYKELKRDKEKLKSYKYQTEKQYKVKYQFLREVDSKALQSSTRNLLISFKNFFNGLKQNRIVGYPVYKSRKHRQSYTTYNINNNLKIKFDQKQLKLPKLKTWVKFRDDRIFLEPIKHVTVSKTMESIYNYLKI